jgi:hypothetical protein
MHSEAFSDEQINHMAAYEACTAGDDGDGFGLSH